MKSAISLSARPWVGSSRISRRGPLAQPHGDLQKTLVAVAEVAGKLIRTVGDTDPLQRLGDAARRLGLVAARPPPQCQRDILGHRQAAIDRGDLEGIGHAGADATVRRLGGDVSAVEEYLAPACRNAARQHADEGRLAGSVRADQGAHLARRKLEIDILHGLQAAEMPAEMACRQQGHGSHLSVRRRSSPTRPCGANSVSATSTRPAISM